MTVVSAALPYLERLLTHLEKVRIAGRQLCLASCEEVPTPQWEGTPPELVVEADTPLQLRESRQPVTSAPSARVLVRSAAERLRQLDLAWGGPVGDIRSPVATIVRAVEAAPVELSPTTTERWSRANHGRPQALRGIVGRWQYQGLSPAATQLLRIGADTGIGKGVAFGCGSISVGSPHGLVR